MKTLENAKSALAYMQEMAFGVSAPEPERVRRSDAFDTSNKGKVLWFVSLRRAFNGHKATGKDAVHSIFTLTAATNSRYTPHQGKRECARRLRQMGA